LRVMMHPGAGEMQYPRSSALEQGARAAMRNGLQFR
jgi:hypothetical protein